jgi:hypothetical protein
MGEGRRSIVLLLTLAATWVSASADWPFSLIGWPVC